MTDRQWVETPRVMLDTELGPIQASFLVDAADVPYVFCHVLAHINDSAPALVYRGQEYIGSVHMVDSGGIWTRTGSAHWSKRPQWSDAPPTHAQALTQACAEAVREYEREHPECIAAGRYASAAQSLCALERELSELDVKRKTLKAQIRHLERVPMVWL